MNIVNYLMSSESKRTIIIKKNIIGSFIIKGMSIITSLYLVPLTINILEKEKYGIWITIYSIITWINMMDIGIGNGFRNKFAEAVAKNDNKLAKKYIQTLYSSIGCVSFCIILIYSVIQKYLNWNYILNISGAFNENIGIIVQLTIILFCIQLLAKNISTILLSLQKTTFSNSLLLGGNILTLIGIYILKMINNVSLLTVSIVFMLSPIIVYIIITIILFITTLKTYKPDTILLLPQKKYLGEIVQLGIKFFIIQLTNIIIFSSSNIIISQLYGPSEVTPYNISFRLFFSIQTIFTIIITPFWTAFTEANAKKDYYWIKTSINKLIKVWGMFSISIIIIWLISPNIFKIWIGNKIIISSSLSFHFAIFTILISWVSIFVYYINGVGKIQLQLYISFIQCILTIPLVILFSKHFEMKINGVIIATNTNLLIFAIIMPIQYIKIIQNRAYGLWNK